ncbi:hypothetical protein V8E51_013977 [Hyaloscypha variabilis]
MLRSVLIFSCLVGAYAQADTNTLSIGYMKTGSTYVSATCPATTATFVTSGSYWGCSPYPSAGLGLVTGCTSGTLLVGGTNDYLCVPGDECNTGYLFSDLSDQSPLTEYGCLPGAGTTSYYRSLPASVLAVVTGSTSSASASPTQTSLTTGSSSPGVSSPVSSSTAPSVSTQNGHSSSKTWIAGAVIGPIFGLALVALGIWVWALKKKAKQNQLTQQQQPVPGPGQGTTSPPGPAELEEQKGSWVFVPAASTPQAPQSDAHQPDSLPRETELPAKPRISELPGGQVPVELAGARKI